MGWVWVGALRALCGVVWLELGLPVLVELQLWPHLWQSPT